MYRMAPVQEYVCTLSDNNMGSKIKIGCLRFASKSEAIALCQRPFYFEDTKVRHWACGWPLTKKTRRVDLEKRFLHTKALTANHWR